jgi:hypothetical protein
MYHDIINKFLNMYQHHQDIPQACTTTSNAYTSNMCHITHDLPQAYTMQQTICQVPKICLKESTKNHNACTSNMCQNYASLHAHKMCLKHVPMSQQDTKYMPQACTITSPTCNLKNMHIDIPLHL